MLVSFLSVIDSTSLWLNHVVYNIMTPHQTLGVSYGVFLVLTNTYLVTWSTWCPHTWRALLSTLHHHGEHLQQTRIDLQVYCTIMDLCNWTEMKNSIFKTMLLKIIQLMIVKSLYEIFSYYSLRCAIFIPFALT